MKKSHWRRRRITRLQGQGQTRNMRSGLLKICLQRVQLSLSRMTRRTHKEMRSCHCRVQKQANHTKHWSSCTWQEGRTHSTCSFLTQNCDERDVVTQYTNTRGGAALPLESLKTISVPIGTQPCDTMGLHPEFTTLRSSGLTRTFRLQPMSALSLSRSPIRDSDTSALKGILGRRRAKLVTSRRRCICHPSGCQLLAVSAGLPSQ